MDHPFSSDRRAALRAGGSALALALAAPALRAQGAWPSKPIQVVVPFPPGGIIDNVTRALQPRLEATLGQPLVIENRAGAGGSIGSAVVAKARPDGYTLLMAFDTHAVNPLLYKLPFDSDKDLTPVALIGVSPLLVVTPADAPVQSIRELVALAKSRPGALNYASTGAGSSNQLAAELFKMTAGIDMAHVPYKGGAPAITDVLGGRVDVMFVSATSVLQHIKAGKMKVLATTTPERIPQLPDVPTVAETYPGYVAQSWLGMLAPGQTPPDIVARLNREVHAALETPALRSLFQAQALRAVPGTPQDFGRFIHAQADGWRDVIRKANIKVD
ncbi:tripartite tricarboxylate transporter substrate binding protein [uncultured Xylophilus sp.]|uniref:tripartite tricarboxylate transporter substrate binding protein n=1 Tax=uncultured Xylophilus sp. TaxID=296832 RepID=UPI0025D98AF5|nr:tripartite tricarboxylate transporter substrate binding protein [uncultured Xylophilus sp.]